MMTTQARPARGPGRPRIAARTTERVQVSMTTDDLAALDYLAEAWAEPGMPPNRSAVIRRVLREWRAMRAAGG